MNYLYRMTHIANIPHILRFGITHRSSMNANPNYVSIGDYSIIDKRNNMSEKTIDGVEFRLGDYIPFYFYARMPMLYNIQHGYGVPKVDADDIIYLIVPLKAIVSDVNRDFLFSDSHAVSKVVRFYDKNSIDMIDELLDRNAIKIDSWADDYLIKEKKQAEFLEKVTSQLKILRLCVALIMM